MPEWMRSVGDWYEDFSQTSDERGGGRAVADGLGQVTAALLYGSSMRSDNVATSERPQLERVLDDDIQPVDVIAALAAVGAMGDMGQL